VRTPSSHPSRLVRALFAVALVALAGCSGGGSSIPNGGSNQTCDPNSAGLQLARPTPGYPQNGNNIEIVAAGNGDQLAQFTNQFDLILRDNFGNEIDTGFLTLVADQNGPHPYPPGNPGDFFYQGTLQNGALQFGRNYNVYLNAPNTNCTPGFVGSFST
jgi:hypothetical protein